MLDDLLHRRLHIPYTLYSDVLQNPRRPRATIVLIHGIGSSTAMWHKLVTQLPGDMRIIAVDLLGFGLSPQPEWARYDANTQAKSLAKTLLLLRIPPRSIIVGHSLGALVAVELARQFPYYVSSLLLICPPIYKPPRNKVVARQPEDVLRGIYKILQRYPKNTERALVLAKRYYVRTTGSQTASGVNITSYLASLESSIINQATISHIGDIKAPILMLSGARDPLVVSRNLDKIAEQNPTIQHQSVKRAGHTVVGTMRSAVARELIALVEDKKRR